MAEAAAEARLPLIVVDPVFISKHGHPLLAEDAVDALRRLLLPLATAWFDYFENEGIAAMLAAGPQAGDELIERTSFWTRAKSLAGLATELVCVIFAAIAFVRWRHRRQSQPR